MPLADKRNSPEPWEAEKDSRLPCVDLDISSVSSEDGQVLAVVTSEQEDGGVVCVDDRRPRCPGTDGNVHLVTCVNWEFVYGSGTALECAETCRVPSANCAECSISWGDVTCSRGPWEGL